MCQPPAHGRPEMPNMCDLSPIAFGELWAELEDTPQRHGHTARHSTPTAPGAPARWGSVLRLERGRVVEKGLLPWSQ